MRYLLAVLSLLSVLGVANPASASTGVAFVHGTGDHRASPRSPSLGG